VLNNKIHLEYQMKFVAAMRPSQVAPPGNSTTTRRCTTHETLKRALHNRRGALPLCKVIPMDCKGACQEMPNTSFQPSAPNSEIIP